MGASFSQAESEKARYWLSRKVYTWGPGSLAAGTTTVFTAQQWQDPAQPQWLARLTRIAVTQNSQVQLQWIYDGATANQTQNKGFTDAMPADLQWQEVDAPAVSLLQLVAINNSGAPIPNFNLNYEIEMQRLTAADKIMLGYGLSPGDTQILGDLNKPNSTGLQQIMDQVKKGMRPLSPSEQLRRYLENADQGEDARISGTYHVTANSSTTESQPFASMTGIPSGYFDVVEQIAIPTMAALTLYVNIDNQSNVLQVAGAAFAQASPAYPWRVFLPALSTISLAVSATSTLTGVPVTVKVRRYRMTDLWKVRLGVATSAQSVGRTFAEVWAGLA